MSNDFWIWQTEPAVAKALQYLKGRCNIEFEYPEGYRMKDLQKLVIVSEPDCATELR